MCSLASPCTPCGARLRSLRLPAVAEPIPLLESGKGSHPSSLNYLLLNRYMAEREGFEPSIPF